MNDEAPAVAVCLCTYRRPAVLARLLHQLQVVAADAEGVARVGIVVVDDDAGASARSVAEGFTNSFALGLQYANTASGNISTARNRALNIGMEFGTWLALIDDDCRPSDDWVRQLMVVQERTGADCVTGHCIDIAPAGAPSWLTTESFLDEFSPGPDGCAIGVGPLKNTLISTSFLRRTGLRFQPALGRTGGEDVSFFYSANDAGMSHHFARHAVVCEEIPLERTTLRYQLGRRLWYGNTEAFTSISGGRYSRTRFLVSGAKQVALSAARPVVNLLRRHPLQWRFAVAEMLRGIGRLLGACGIRLRHH